MYRLQAGAAILTAETRGILIDVRNGVHRWIRTRFKGTFY